MRGIVGSLIATLLASACATTGSAQTVPEEARRYMARGMAALELAKTPEDYDSVIREFEQAAKLAPEWPDVFFNLGTVQAKARNYGEAARHYKRYLELAPGAPDAAKVRQEMYKLEYLAEQEAKTEALSGTWESNIRYQSQDLRFVVTVQQGQFMATSLPIPDPADKLSLLFKGSIDRRTLKGIWKQAPYTVTNKKNKKPRYYSPEVQGELTGIISADGRRITLTLIVPTFSLEDTHGSKVPSPESGLTEEFVLYR